MRLLAAILGIFLLAGTAAAQTQTAVKANDFLNSLGMNTDAVKGTSTPQQVEWAIQFTGVRNFREEATHNTTGPESYQAECDIHSVTGAMVSTIAIVDSEFYGEPQGAAITDEKKALDTLATCGALGLVESHNEPANEPFPYLGNECSLSTSFLPCAQYERDMYAMVNSDPQLAGRPISGMSEPGAEPDDAGLQYLTVPSNDPNVKMPAGTKLADMADSHGYTEGNGQSTPIDNQSRLASDIYNGKFNSTPYAGTWDVYAEYWGATWAHAYPAAPCTSDAQCQNVLPKVQTEDGWNVYGTGHDNTFCPTVGNLLVDKYLDNYQLGYLNTFVYHMVDATGDAGWCVYNANPTSATDTADALPVALYLHNLTQILADPSSAFTPVTVSYPVVGMPPTGYFMPVEKSNGTMEYVLWGEAFQSGTATQVTVNLPASYPVVNVYDVTATVNPSGPPAPVIYNNVNSVNVTLKDHPVVVEFNVSSCK